MLSASPRIYSVSAYYIDAVSAASKVVHLLFEVMSPRVSLLLGLGTK